MASIAGALIGSSAASGDQASEQAALQAALNNIQNINVPTISQQEINLAKEQNAGQLNPEMEGTVNQGASGLGNISVDPRLRNAQMQALASLQQQGQTGLSAADRLGLNQVLNQQAQQSNSQNQAVLQNMAARGMGGSGASLAAQLANNQNSANNGQQRALQVAAQAQQNALNATAQSGQLGSSLEGQQYGEAANAANAQDYINRFNAQNQQQIMGQNTQNKNYAQQYNLGNAQSISNQNTGLQNQQEMHNKGLYQQQFANNMQKAGALSGAENNMAGYYGNQANATRGEWAGIGQGIDQAAMSAYGGGMLGGAPADLQKAQTNYLKSQTYSEGGEIPAPVRASDLGLFKFLQGGTVPGKEVVPGDSTKNDIVPIMASAGEIVLPKEIAQHDNPDVITAFVKGVKSANKKVK